MKLTKENKKIIDNLSYKSLLIRWRNTPSGDIWFSGETGDYWGKRMDEMKKTVNHVKISKEIGWN